jgi:hypothetical protein
MMETEAIPSARTRILPPRDARGRFMARPSAAPKAPRVRAVPPRDARGRVRALPSRGARGRFVSFPMRNAPSWYVLCADGYRIPGEAALMPIDTRPAPQPEPLPVARVMRRRRSSMQWDEWVTWLLMALFVVVVGWYGVHLPRPHH